METLWWVLLLAVPATTRDVTDEEYSKFPRLYHLDDYSTCLSQTGGLYCLGTFSITPLKEPHHVYNLLKEYSEDPHHFNRTELHRGYCVSSRCPSLASERNASLRFEQCAAQWARRLSLRTSLTKLSYCRTHAQQYARTHNPDPMDLPQKVFLYVVAAIVAMNVIGTTYDAVTGDNAKKSAVLSAWSVRVNWRRLTASHEDGDPRLAALAPVQGVRVFLMLLIMVTHSGCIQDMMYLYNPRWIEQVSRHPALMIFLNGTSVVQIFVMLSNFLLAYNLLLFAEKNKLTYKLLPLITLKRIARISPVYILMVGFSATWWPRGGDGPLWMPTVGAEAAACRRKFWTHVFYVNNLIEPEDICLVQTWFLAVDMQLYVWSSLLCVYLCSRRRGAVWLLVGLLLLSCALNGILAYIFDWKSIMYFAYPRNVKTMYAGISSFSRLYQSAWASAPAALAGLLLAFLHHRARRHVTRTDLQWLRVPYRAAPALIVLWLLSGNCVREYTAPLWTALYVALERPLLSLLAAVLLFGMINGFEGWVRSWFSWAGWRVAARASLSVLMLHWSVNLALAAARAQPAAASVASVAADWLATSVSSYAAALPLTLLVEMPTQRFVTSLVARTHAHHH